MVVVFMMQIWTGTHTKLNMVCSVTYTHPLYSLFCFLVCHAEVNAIIAAFRREADLSACTLYTTLSPCEDCSKLVAQSGIKNVVFGRFYKKDDSMGHILGRKPEDVNIT